MNCTDLKCGDGLHSSTVTAGADEESIAFGQAEGSCYSQSYSTADSSIHGSNIDCESDFLDSRRVSSVVGSNCIVDIDNGVPEHVISLGKVERECRICNSSFRDMESGIAVELGCSCKDDLGAAHQHCAETWFRIKGNNICEICHSIAQNVVIPDDIESMRQTEVDTSTGNSVSSPLSAFETVDLGSSRQSFEFDTSTTTADAVEVWPTSDCWGLLPYILLILVACGILFTPVYY